MIPRERPPPKDPVDPREKASGLAKRQYALVEMMNKQHETLVDGIREQGKKSTNMLVRVAMMNEKPVFADGMGASLPSSMTNIEGKYPPPRDTSSKEDLVKGGSGENLYLVSRGVAPSVVPAKYGGDYQSVMKSTYADHWDGSNASKTKNVYATHAGAAQAKDWADAGKRKKELEEELKQVNSAISGEEKMAHQSATAHGLYGRLVPESSDASSTMKSTMAGSGRILTNLKGLTVKRGTTMSDSFVEHPLRREKKWGVSIFDHDSTVSNPTSKPNTNANTLTINGITRRIPSNPSSLQVKPGSNVVGSAFQWKETHNRSSKANDFSLPSSKLAEVDPDTEKETYRYRFNTYDITKTKYGESARECDIVRGSIHVVPKAISDAEKAKRMQPQ